MSASKAFAPRLDLIAEVVGFSAEAFASEAIDAGLRPAVDLCLEELFTNLVRHGRSAAPIRIDMRPITGGVEVSLCAEGVDDFDPTQAPTVDVSVPIDQRQPGGLGLHLVHQLVDSIEYEYQEHERRSRVTFRKTQA